MRRRPLISLGANGGNSSAAPTPTSSVPNTPVGKPPKAAAPAAANAASAAAPAAAVGVKSTLKSLAEAAASAAPKVAVTAAACKASSQPSTAPAKPLFKSLAAAAAKKATSQGVSSGPKTHHVLEGCLYELGGPDKMQLMRRLLGEEASENVSYVPATFEFWTTEEISRGDQALSGSLKKAVFAQKLAAFSDDWKQEVAASRPLKQMLTDFGVTADSKLVMTGLDKAAVKNKGFLLVREAEFRDALYRELEKLQKPKVEPKPEKKLQAAPRRQRHESDDDCIELSLPPPAPAPPTKTTPSVYAVPEPAAEIPGEGEATVSPPAPAPTAPDVVGAPENTVVAESGASIPATAAPEPTPVSATAASVVVVAAPAAVAVKPPAPVLATAAPTVAPPAPTHYSRHRHPPKSRRSSQNRRVSRRASRRASRWRSRSPRSRKSQAVPARKPSEVRRHPSQVRRHPSARVTNSRAVAAASSNEVIEIESSDEEPAPKRLKARATFIDLESSQEPDADVRRVHTGGIVIAADERSPVIELDSSPENSPLPMTLTSQEDVICPSRDDTRRHEATSQQDEAGVAAAEDVQGMAPTVAPRESIDPSDSKAGEMGTASSAALVVTVGEEVHAEDPERDGNQAPVEGNGDGEAGADGPEGADPCSSGPASQAEDKNLGETQVSATDEASTTTGASPQDGDGTEIAPGEAAAKCQVIAAEGEDMTMIPDSVEAGGAPVEAGSGDLHTALAAGIED